MRRGRRLPPAHDSSQPDTDGDGAGDACDTTPCGVLNAYVTDLSAYVHLADLTSGGSSTIALVSSGIRGVTVDDLETTAWITDTSSGSVLRMPLPFGFVSLVDSGLSQPWGIVDDPMTGRIYVTEESSGKLSYIDGMGMTFPVVGGLAQPRGVDIAPNGMSLLVADYGSGRLLEIDPFSDEGHGAGRVRAGSPWIASGISPT